jgi:hypothetical protein
MYITRRCHRFQISLTILLGGESDEKISEKFKDPGFTPRPSPVALDKKPILSKSVYTNCGFFVA